MRFKIGSIYIYITKQRMKKRGKRDNYTRNHRFALLTEKERRWRKNGGCCEECGKKMAMHQLEMHHVIPVSERPDLITRKSNLKMLCHECHMKKHQDTK